MANAQTPGGDDLMAPRPTREVYEYDIPDELAELAVTPSFGAIRSVGLQLLTPLEEKQAARRANGDPMSLAYELAMMAFAEINGGAGRPSGKRLDIADGTKDLAFSEMHPQIRNLVVQAYSEIAVAPQSATTSFLKSRRIKV